MAMFKKAMEAMGGDKKGPTVEIEMGMSDMGKAAERSAMKDFLAAVKAGDPGAMSEALMAHYEACGVKRDHSGMGDDEGAEGESYGE